MRPLSATECVRRVANWTVAFRDPDICGGQPDWDEPGTPRSQSGQFATCFWFTLADGQRQIIRIFRHEQPQLRERYAALHAHFAEHPLDCLVDFEFLDPGFGTAAGPVPILKMGLVVGDRLDDYLPACLQRGDLAAVERLEQAWVAMVAGLEEAGIAHGDLHPGNILVAGGRLVLVDYDGMYVPALGHLTSCSQGMPAFNHPDRGDQFGPFLDRFPAWVMLTSLRILRRNPALLGTEPDRALVFTVADYRQPDATETWRQVRAIDDPLLQEWLDLLAEACRRPLRDCPPLPVLLAPADGWREAVNAAVERADWPTVWVLLDRAGEGAEAALPPGGARPGRVARSPVTAWGAFAAAVKAGDHASAMLLWSLVRDLELAESARPRFDTQVDVRAARRRPADAAQAWEAYRAALARGDRVLALLLWPRVADRPEAAADRPLLDAWRRELAPWPA